jgi:hypothetical protein
MGKIGKIVTIILWVLIVVSAVLVISLIANIGEDTDAVMGGWIDTNLVWAYILIAFGAGAAVLAGLFHTITNKKALKGGIISLVFMGAIALISYLLASPEIPRFPGVDKFIQEGLTEGVSKMVDTGLIATYILLAIAILSIVVTPVVLLFK